MRRLDSIGYKLRGAPERRYLKRGAHTVAWKVSGAGNGIPVLVIHGGPGSQNRDVYRKFFDPDVFRVIQIEQRGNGASEPAGELLDNTTAHLIDDIESVRRELDIEDWLVFGGSWGSTLALQYCAQHRHRCKGLLLTCVWLARPEDVAWFEEAGRSIFPEAYEELCYGLSQHERGEPLMSHCRRVLSGAPAIAAQSARQLFEYELVLMYFEAPIADGYDIDAELYARIYSHYLLNGCFLERPLLEALGDLGDLPPTKIVHGRYDMCTPPRIAFDLKRAFPKIDLRIVGGAGHMPTERALFSEVVRAADEFKRDLGAAAGAGS